MRTIQWILTMMAGVLTAAVLHAAESDQFYFLARSAPADSMTAQAPEVVYLRWDVVEGSLPADIDRFVVKRDGTQIAAFPARTTMTAEAIAALYAPAEQARRKAETIAWLDDEGAQSDPPYRVDASNFAQVIYDHLHDENAPMWGMLAGRNDFNIARARYRGMIDASVAGGHTYRYELLAENNASGTPQYVRMGEASVAVGSVQPLPKVTDFEQVHGVGRCDAPERFKEHGTLYLNWSHPGTNKVEKYGNALMISGYDLYCTTTDTPPASPVDIAALASAGGYDSRGEPIMPSWLVKLNDRPVTISAEAHEERRYKGWNPPFSQLMLLPDDLREKGMGPGDRRYCFAVARDFTGNYSQTSDELNVTVPDMTPPPAPWNVWTTKYTHDDTFRLEWLNTDVANYYAEHTRGRKYCNLPTARLDKDLEWVGADQSCDANTTRRIALDPQEYLVYRFDSVAAAQNFKDSDGDGYSDSDESAPVAGAALLRLPGTACKYDAAGTLPYPNYLAARVAAVPAARIGGKSVVTFTDTEVPLHKGKYFWYRIATRDANGQLSELSQPVRAFFPKRALPDRPADRIGTKRCWYSAGSESTSNVEGGIPHPVFLDFSKKADYGTIGCASDERVLMTKTLRAEGYFAAQAKTAYLDAAECRRLNDINTRCSSEVAARFYKADGTKLAETTVSRWLCSFVYDEQSDSNLSEPSDTAELTAECGGEVEPPEDGTVTDEPIYLDPSGIDDCIKVGYRVNGVYYLEGTHCPPFGGLVPIETPQFGGGELCVEYELQNDNAESSMRFRAPCVIRPFTMKVFAPQAVSIVPSATEPSATIVWAPPKQTIVATMLEWYRKDGSSYHSDLVPYDKQNLSADGTQSLQVSITAPPPGSEWQEEWCFHARTLGKTGGAPEEAYSEWSDEVCAIRQPEAAVLPQYIPWPKIALPENDGSLNAGYFRYDGLPIIELTDTIDVEGEGCGRGIVPDCLYGANHCLVNGPIQGDCRLCKLLRDALGDSFAFVVYRQEADEPGAAGASAYYQVSPLIDRLYCSSASRVEDPFVTLVHYRVGDDVVDEYKMVYRDLFAHEIGKYYRYQIVYFDRKGEITGYKQTGWVQAVAP